MDIFSGRLYFLIEKDKRHLNLVIKSSLENVFIIRSNHTKIPLFLKAGFLFDRKIQFESTVMAYVFCGIFIIKVLTNKMSNSIIL